VDIALPFLEHAQKRLLDKALPNLRYFQADATALPFLNNTFDAVVMADVLEHLPDLRRALAEAYRVPIN
jgi:ubiquinone/menaquinone biosynthesis C-methylase UbiE